MNSFNPDEGKLVASAKVFEAANFILRRYESEVNHEFLEKFCRFVCVLAQMSLQIYCFSQVSVSNSTVQFVFYKVYQLELGPNHSRIHVLVMWIFKGYC